MGETIGGLDSAYRDVFNMLSQGSLKKVASVIHPKVSSSSSPNLLRREITHFVRKNYGVIGTKFYPGLISIILDKVSEKALSSDLDEPHAEVELKPLIRRAAKDLGFTPHSKEVPIPPATRADIVGYKGRRSKHRVRKHLGRIPLPMHEERTEKWFEFLGVELKTAKRAKDPLYRQVSVYAKYFDHAFTVVTPLTLLTQPNPRESYAFFRDFYAEMKSKRVGIVLATRNHILGTILASKCNDIAERERRHLNRQINPV
jgi:hypothetical protein